MCAALNACASSVPKKRRKKMIKWFKVPPYGAQRLPTVASISQLIDKKQKENEKCLVPFFLIQHDQPVLYTHTDTYFTKTMTKNRNMRTKWNKSPCKVLRLCAWCGMDWTGLKVKITKTYLYCVSHFYTCMHVAKYSYFEPWTYIPLKWQFQTC